MSALSANPAARPEAIDLARYLDDLVKPGHATGRDIDRPPGQQAFEGQIVMPFYLVFDVSYSMIDAIDTLNDAMRSMWHGILANPLVDDTAQVCLISFSDVARVIRPMASASESTPPVVSVEGGTNYSGAFRLLARTIAADTANLKRDGYRVFRPCAFFLTDGAPLDDDWFDVFTRELTYDPRSGRGTRQYPTFVPFGFGDAPEGVIRRLAYPPGRSTWYHSGSSDLSEGLSRVLSVIMNTVMASGASVATGRPILTFRAPGTHLEGTDSVSPEEIAAPEGIASPEASDDDDDWI